MAKVPFMKFEVKHHVEIGENLRSLLHDFVAKIVVNGYAPHESDELFKAVSDCIVGSIKEAIKERKESM